MSWAIWITGVPGSGKSALARAAARRLRELGEPVRVLELDEIRKAITPTPVYSEAEREIVYRALGCMAALLTGAGVPVIVDATAHRRRWRDLARAAIPCFAEVQLVCPPEVCRERERTRPPGHAPRGIYARAGTPGATVPGVDVPYEPALAPELVIDTAAESVAEGAERIVELARQLAVETPAELAERSGGWAIWITGRPGSGKTTLAERVAEQLASDDIPVKVLDVGAVRRFLLHGSPGSEAEQEIAHRALAYAAKLLSDAGVAVIVDATAPRRVWREVDLPIAARALAVAGGFAFAIALGEFGATVFLARPDRPTLPVVIFRLLGQPGPSSFGAAMAASTILLVLAAVSVLLVDRARVADVGTF